MAFATGINLETGKTELFDFINVSKSGTYKGLWDASTNTPFLTNGTGEDGDYYEVSVGGTVNFGEGDIIFVAGDTVAYSRGKWQKGDKPLINDEEITYDTTWSSAKILQVIETASTANVYTYKGKTAVLPDGTEETPNNKGDVWLLTTDGLPYWWDGDVWRRFGVDAYTKAETENVIEEKLGPVKTKLETIEEGAEVNSIKSISVNDTEIVPDKDKNVNIVVPTKVSDIENDSEFITKAVNDLVNYYKKSETYSQDEVNTILADMQVKIQYDVMPTPSSETVGMIVQYTGADTQDYKNSYFYKGIDKGNDTYGWELAKTGKYEDIIDDSATSTSTTWSSEKIRGELSYALEDKADYKLVVEDGTRYVEDIVAQDINTWLPNDNSSILVNLKKRAGSTYTNFQLLCNKQDSQNWSCITSGAIGTLWKIRYVNGVRYVDELATMDNVESIVKYSGTIRTTVNSGYVQINNPIGKSCYVVCTPQYISTELIKPYVYIGQATPSYINIYIRQSDGSLPPDGIDMLIAYVLI